MAGRFGGLDELAIESDEGLAMFRSRQMQRIREIHSPLGKVERRRDHRAVLERDGRKSCEGTKRMHDVRGPIAVRASQHPLDFEEHRGGGEDPLAAIKTRARADWVARSPVR